MKTILFIDGRNFISKIDSVIKAKREKTDFSIYNFKGLFNNVLAGIKIDRKIFYFGKLVKHFETIEKSEQLINEQRRLKTQLENQGFEVMLAGRVRGHMEKCPLGHEMLTFKEKGVDVKVAVDMVTMACSGKLGLAIIASSDSDLQPAIYELTKAKVERIYLGFENSPNKGLIFTTNRTILIRNSEVIEYMGKSPQGKKVLKKNINDN